MRRLILVVSRILIVTRSSGHQPSRKDLQNKQGTGGSVSAASLILSQTEKSGEKVCQFINRVLENLPVAIPSLFMKEEDDPLFMESE